jgi:hypothetical protein
MVVHRTALWIVLVACSMAGGLYGFASELRAPRPAPARSRFERYLFGTLTGVGIGMGVATLTLFAAAIIVRLEP